MRRRDWFAGLGGATLLVALLVSVGAANAAGPVSWGLPVRVDHSRAYVSSGGLNTVSCPSARLCVAVDNAGGVNASTDPAGPASSWRLVHDGGIGLSQVSCPSFRLCVAVDEGQDVVVSSKPSTRAWSVVRLDRAAGLGGVSCASASLCVAFDRARLFVSTDPAGGASDWKAVRVESAASLTGVSCASRFFCAAVDSAGNVITSKRPTRGRKAWRRVRVVAPGTGLTMISCPSRSLCVAGDTFGNLITSSRPTRGRAAWRAGALPPDAGVSAVSCRSASFCVAVGYGGLGGFGYVAHSSEPSGGAGAWGVTNIDSVTNTDNTQLSGVSCASRSLCVATVYGGVDVLTSTNPAGGASAWRANRIPTAGYDGLGSISCPSRSLCAALDDAGNVITSTHPAARVRAWKTVHLPASGEDISCPSASFCAALGNGYVLTSHRPTGGSSAWTATPAPHDLGGLSCPTASLCAAFSGNQILTSSNPAGGQSTWSVRYTDPVTNDPYFECGHTGCPPVVITALTCRSATLCVALDNAGDVLSSTDPAAGALAWQTHQVDAACYRGPCYGDSASCPSVSFCLASMSTAFFNSTLSSTSPASGTWKVAATPGVSALSPESCASARLCVGLRSGRLVASTKPTRGRWTASYVDRRATAVSCPTASLCVAIDAVGNVIVGKRTSP